MSDSVFKKGSHLLTILGTIGAFLIFGLLLFIAYLPNLPEPVNHEISEQRILKADKARAAGEQKISSFAVVDAENGRARIPLDDAIALTVNSYQNNTKVWINHTNDASDKAAEGMTSGDSADKDSNDDAAAVDDSSSSDSGDS